MNFTASSIFLYQEREKQYENLNAHQEPWLLRTQNSCHASLVRCPTGRIRHRVCPKQSNVYYTRLFLNLLGSYLTRKWKHGQ